MGILLGLLSSLSFGTGDFIGGTLSRRGSALSIVLASQAAGAVLLLPFALAVGSDQVGAGLAWGALAGVGVGSGVMFLYRGLARGRMGVVATVSAVVVSVIPVAAGFLLGERPTTTDLIGIVVAVGAVALIAGSGRVEHPVPAAAVETSGLAAAVQAPPAGRWAGLAEGVAAGVLLGLARVALQRAPDVAGLWPAEAARVSGVVVLAIVALATRTAIRLPGSRRWLVLVVGALEATASSLFLVATTRGLLAVVSVVASLGPAVTVLLARFVLHERLSRLQLAGVALALAGVVLIALA